MVVGLGLEGGCYEITESHNRDLGDRADHSVRGGRRRLSAVSCFASKVGTMLGSGPCTDRIQA